MALTKDQKVKADNLWEPGQSSINCWHCKKPIQIPPKLVFTHPKVNIMYF